MTRPALLPVPGARRGLPADAGVLCCRDLLAQRIAARMGADGLLAAPCESRLLESALALHLLTLEQAEPAAAERLRHFVRTAHPSDLAQRAIARAVLGGSAPGGGAPPGFGPVLGAGPESLMLRTVLAELGVGDLPRIGAAEFGGLDPRVAPLPGRTAELTAVRVLAAHSSGTPRAVTGQDWAALAPACRPGPAAEGNQLARLLGLLALRRNPAYRPAVRRALPDLAAAQRPDGGLPFITGTDVLAAAAGGLALLAARWPGPQPGVLADALAAQQNPDGGFGHHPGMAQSDVETTARCIEFLRSVAPGRHRGTITAAEEHLIARRNPDGGFPATTRGTPSELATTAAAVTALAPDPAHQRTIAQARRFVLARQQADGSFGRSRNGSATEAVLHAVLALAPESAATANATADAAADATATLAAAARLRAVDWLAETQAQDGGWGRRPEDPSDPVSTAGGAIALGLSPAVHADRATHPALRRALDHLVGHRAPDGGYPSRPDQVDPWQLPYDVPLLTEIRVLLGLSRAGSAGPAGEPTALSTLTPSPTPSPDEAPDATLQPLIDLSRRPLRPAPGAAVGRRALG
ncbi:squalene-hopene/tetraprenyl-beta-curcumene cyclase [Kitasatospora sp. MAA4]|uniref:terpene cyclase/mutase family protein n=1 Tax=Kitasatospora sp. MAA4 TaxID=3035093 RepID=UPI0024756992|nr:terpene cyclase/mutase family protein [Kitasatospora sp. MAA4]MDH6135592.1 squalene-hopene/tetraprenyl-beta-curcumene cyclase [Kitasatospora sp. MAA4]